MIPSGEIVGILNKVVEEGQHGPYAVVTPKPEYQDKVSGTVTFSMAVWKESENPEGGVWVVLGDLQRKEAGWRAGRARLYRPEDAS